MTVRRVIRTDRLESWSVAYPGGEPHIPPEARTHFHLRGFSEAKQARVFTSRVVSSAGLVVTTETGTEYTLGEIDPEYAAWLAANGIPLDPAQPAKVVRR